MGMNIVGNVNGSYKAPKIDLFEIAEQRGVDQQPVKDYKPFTEVSYREVVCYHGNKAGPV